MKILLCPDKFKGSLTALQVCVSLRAGLLEQNPNLDIIMHPMADGGDGSIDILKTQLKLKSNKVNTVDPFGRSIEAVYYYSDDMACIELASASGLALLDKMDRNPMLTSTVGTGLMIKDAIENGFNKINLFIGGSATNDGGIGIAQALGYDFYSDKNEKIDPIGGNLEKIKSIRDTKQFDFESIEINVLCDVENPMHGPNGAAHIYASQKGAKKHDIIKLDNGLKNYDQLLKAELNKDISNIPGMGAAGGVGASLVGLMNAKLQNGFQMLAGLTKLEDAIHASQIVITGEGKIDKTSFQGKVVGEVLLLCKRHAVPYGIVSGMFEEINKKNLNSIFQKSIISLAQNFEDARHSPEKYLIAMGRELASSLARS